MFRLWIFLFFGVQTLFGLEYLGCYNSSEFNSELSVRSSKDFGTPSGCIEECRSHYYMFAGLMAGQKCYCGSTYGRSGLSDNCTMPCSNNATSMCGSVNAMSIYATGQKGPSPPRRVEAFHSHDGAGSLLVTWLPPDNPNGNLTSYTVRAEAVETYASNPLPPFEVQVEGGASNSTVISGLQRGTKYNISVTAENLKGISDPAFGSGWTLLGPPNKPKTPIILENSGDTMKIKLTKGSSENGPITFYQVIVVHPGVIPPSGSNVAYPSYDQSNEDDLGYYVTGEFDALDFPRYEEFVVGDGKNIGGYYNAPLKEDSIIPQVGLVLVSRNRDSVQYSYSNLTKNLHEHKASTQTHTKNTLLWLCIGILGFLLVISIFTLLFLNKKLQRGRRQRPHDQQELRLQGPILEVDNMAYMPDDVPERRDPWEESRSQVWSIPRNFLNLNANPIRRGEYGTTHIGEVQREGNTIRVTVQCITDRIVKKSAKLKMMKELNVCTQLESMSFIIDFIGTCIDPETTFIVIERPPQTLKEKLLASRSGELFSHEHFLKMGAGIATGLRYLSERGIVHTHLCARSVGLFSDYTPKIMGFGVGVHTLEDFKYARWTATECFENKKRDQTSVVWAFGILLWEIFSLGGTPYVHLALDSEVQTAVESGERLKQMEDVPDPVYEVMKSCWNADAGERPTFEELVRLDTLTAVPIQVTEDYVEELELHVDQKLE